MRFTTAPSALASSSRLSAEEARARAIVAGWITRGRRGTRRSAFARSTRRTSDLSAVLGVVEVVVGTYSCASRIF